MKGAFLDSLGRDYYVIGTASDIQVNVVRDKRQNGDTLGYKKKKKLYLLTFHFVTVCSFRGF